MSALIPLRPYQQAAFLDRTTGIEVWLMGRQTGKSYTLAAWAVDRLLTNPGRLVTVLSNSKDNGGELNLKCAEVCQKVGEAFEQEDLSPDGLFENMRMETRVKARGRWGRIKVLAANPRTARGFSGDLILDEFGFHENSHGIWDAAEPILTSNPGYLCRVASTPNGKYNMLYQMVTGGLIPVRRVPRSLAWQQGLKVYHPITRKEITPDEARALALDKRSYDQNYELVFTDENMALLTLELISAAERSDVGEICTGEWSPAALARMRSAVGPLYLGGDIGRTRDLTVLVVVEKLGQLLAVRGILRLEGMRLPHQQRHAAEVCRMPRWQGAALDQTGLGLGLVEYLQEEFGTYRVRGVNFASTVPMTDRIRAEGRGQATVRVTEAMAVNLLGAFEDRRLQLPSDPELRDDLRKPERITSPGGKVSIAATRDEAGHADHFWGLALAVDAATEAHGPLVVERVARPGRTIDLGGMRRRVLI